MTFLGRAERGAARLWRALIRLLVLLTLLMSFRAPALAQQALQFHVSTQGNDQWSGRSEQSSAAGQGPLRTWAAAQGAVRRELARMRAGQQPWQPIQVIFLPGDYALEREMRFAAEDAGEPDAPVSYIARTPGTVRISGGRRLVLASGQGASGVGLTGLPQGWNPADPGQLYVGGRRAVLARQPDAGREWFVAQAASLPGQAAGPGKAGFMPPDEARRWLEQVPARDRQRAFVNVYQSWTNSLHHLGGDVAGGANGAVWQVVPAALWAFVSQGRSQRFHIENVPAALDAPGEWIGDEGRITYLPRAQETPAAIGRDAVLAVLERLVVFDERAAAGSIHDIRFDGLVFEHVRQSIPAGGLLDWQAAVKTGAAVEVNNAVRIDFDRCTVRHTGGYGLWLRSQVRDSRITRSTFDDLGGGGIKVGLPNQKSADPPATGMNEISQNIVRHTGQIMAGAIGIWIGQSWDNVVRHNLIAYTTYTAISVGWKWGYGEPSAGRNTIEANLIHNIGQGMLADLGGIYTLGPSPGTVIRGNVIREVRGYRDYGAGAWGIYNDEGTSGVLVTNNVVIGTNSGAYHLHYGRDNLIRSNLFAGGLTAEIRITKGNPNGVSVTLEDNLIDTTAAKPLDGSFGERDAFFRGNRLRAVDQGGQPVRADRCGDGCRAADVHVRADSRPNRIELDGLDPAEAARWAAIVREAGPDGLTAGQLGTVDLTPPVILTAGVQPFMLDLAGVPVGSRPPGLTYYASAEHPQAIAVTAWPDDASRKCLKFTDGDAGPRYEPFAFVKPFYREGAAEVEFDLWVDDRVEFIHEWRDMASPYRVGPSLQILPRGIVINGRVVGPVTPRQWLHVSIRAPLGARAGHWDLDITGAAEVHLKQLDVPGKPGDWRHLEWLGFVSNTAGASEACLAGLSVRPR